MELSTHLLPQSIANLLQNRLKLPIKHLVEAIESTAIGSKSALVQRLSIDHHFYLQLLPNPL